MNALTNSQNRWYDAIFFHLEPVDGFVAGSVQWTAALVNLNVQQCIVFDTVPLFSAFGHVFSFKNLSLTCHKHGVRFVCLQKRTLKTYFSDQSCPCTFSAKYGKMCMLLNMKLMSQSSVTSQTSHYIVGPVTSPASLVLYLAVVIHKMQP